MNWFTKWLRSIVRIWRIVIMVYSLIFWVIYHSVNLFQKYHWSTESCTLSQVISSSFKRLKNHKLHNKLTYKRSSISLKGAGAVQFPWLTTKKPSVIMMNLFKKASSFVKTVRPWALTISYVIRRLIKCSTHRLSKKPCPLMTSDACSSSAHHWDLPFNQRYRI